jgi:hypothetical protein
MADNTMTLTTTMSYKDPGGVNQNITKATSIPYDALSEGTIRIEEGTPAGTEYDVPMGYVGSPTFVRVDNRSGQELEVLLGSGGTGPNEVLQLPNGGTCIPVGAPAEVAMALGGETGPAAPITSVSVKTSAVGPTGPNRAVDYWVAGGAGEGDEPG